MVSVQTKANPIKDSTNALLTGKPQDHPDRKEAPVILGYSRGSEVGLDDVELDEEALGEIREVKLAKTTNISVQARWAWWCRRCLARGWPPLVVTPRKLEVAAALLRKGRYRSGQAYIGVIKHHFIRSGGRWTHQLDQVNRELNRAMARGLGPPRRAAPLPIDEFNKLHADQVETRRKDYWPAAGMATAIASSAWLLREIESSAAMLGDIMLHEGDGEGDCGWAEWSLPATKTDTRAEGVVRALACACPSKSCPVLALRQVATTSELIRLGGRQSWSRLPSR